MNDKTKLGLRLAGAALLAGVLGDALLRATPWGVNFPLWVSATVAAMMWLGRWSSESLWQRGRWLAIVGAGFAATFAWRGSGALLFFNGVACFAALTLISVRTKSGSLRLAGVGEYLAGALVSFINQAFGPLLLLLHDISWREVPLGGKGQQRPNWTRNVGAAVKGLLIAGPLLLVFGVLLVAADAAFERFVTQTLNFNPEQIVGHVATAILCAWIAAGLLHSALLRTELTGPAADPQQQLAAPTGPTGPAAIDKRLFSLGIVELGVVLGLLNLLFLTFVIVQFRYFFGGQTLVTDADGFTYAEYARRGFFELVTVAALVLPLLLAAHWLLRAERPTHKTIFRGLAATQLCLLFVIMFSAVSRMRLYQSEYGLTELRVYTTAFMAWLAAAMLWFAYAVLWRDERRQFAFGALLCAFLTLGALNVINPDDLIVRANLRLAGENRRFDARYATSLGADAVPALIEALPKMSPADVKGETALHLLNRWGAEATAGDWRSWNRARARAFGLVGANAAELQRLAQMAPPPVTTSDVEQVHTDF